MQYAGLLSSPMKKGHAYLLSMISDGDIHSGEELASKLDISRAAIWKSIKHLESLGLFVEAVPGKGYRLLKPIELFSAKKIKKSLSSTARICCRDIDVLFKTESTNLHLFNQLGSGKIHGNVVLAEYQSHGRGRRGNKWISPLGSGICFSVGWRFDVAPAAPGLLSLYMGVAMVRSLDSARLKNVGLKWPNDIVVMNKKLGGILLEMRGEAGGPVDVIIGVGINYELTKTVISAIDQPVIDICSLTDQRLSRNRITATFLSNIFEILENIKSGSDSELLDEWRQYDNYTEQKARLILPDKKVNGVIKGVDNQGSLLMSVNGSLMSFQSGELSLRV